MEVEIIARETIKPLSPTPDTFRNFNLSLLDHLSPPSYGPLLFFYPFHGDSNESTNNFSQRLKNSLSHTLTWFFPLAGRLKDGLTIDCNDDGAVYVEARVNCRLSEFLQKPNAEALAQFLPVKLEPEEASCADSLLQVQSSFFRCGGIAIAVCLSHKLADATPLIAFIKSWAAATLGSAEAAVTAPLHSASSPSRFPTVIPTSAVSNVTKGRCVTKRLVFDASKIAALMSISASASVQQPTSVEVVTALIWKCAMNASRSNLGFSRLSLLSQAVDILRRIEPSSTENSVGNLVGYFTAQKDESDEIELQGLVRELRKGKQDFDKIYGKKLKSGDALEVVTESLKDVISMLISYDDIELYACSSLCNFPLYDVDFGWGKPTWVSIPGGFVKNFMKLIDTKVGDGSVEAWVSLSEEDMALFEQDRELLSYASLNPSVVLNRADKRYALAVIFDGRKEFVIDTNPGQTISLVTRIWEANPTFCKGKK